MKHEQSNSPSRILDENNIGNSVTIAISSLNGGGKLFRTLDSIFDMGFVGLNVILVDDGSSDGTPDKIAAHFKEKVRLIKHSKNLGVSAARQTAIMTCETPYLMLADDDLIFSKNCLLSLYREMLKESAAIACPRLLSLQTGKVQGDETFIYFLCGAIIPNRNLWKSEIQNNETRQTITTASGGNMLLDVKQIREFGGFDTSYFFCFEDGEMCIRLSNAGKKILFVPEAEIQVELKEWGINRAHLQVRNRWYVIISNYNLKTIVLLSPAFFLYELILFSFMSLKKGGLLQYLRGMYSLFRHLPERLQKRKSTLSQKKVSDADWLSPGELYVNPTLLQKPIFVFLKKATDTLFNNYWHFIRKYL